MDSDIPPETKSNFTWSRFWQGFHFWEKIAFCFFLSAGLISGIFLITAQPKSFTEFKPVFGGIYREGVIGQPRFLNPLYSPANNPDQDIVELVFSGLMKYDENGNLVPDLAEDYSISEDGRSYRFILKENIFWHDYEPVTVDDIIFTINTIQNPDYKSPLRAGWLGVELEKISDRELIMTLDAPYNSFLETTTTKIIPRHIWKETPALTFPLAVSSTLSFIGSGPYRFESLDLDNQKKVQSLNLEFFNRYYIENRPYLSQITFRFYEDEEALINGARKNEIDGFALTNGEYPIESNFTAHYLQMPRYFSVFFNPEKSQLLAINAIRRALSYAIDKEKLVTRAAEDKGSVIDSPILPEFYGFNQANNEYYYDLSKAIDILDSLGYVLNESSGYREKKQSDDSSFKSDLKSGSQGNEVRELQECLAKFSDIYPEGDVTGYFGPKTEDAVIRFQEKYHEDILEPWGFTAGTGLVSRTTRAKLNEICSENNQSDLLEFTLTTIDQPHLIKLAQALKEQWQEAGIKVNIKYLSAGELESAVINPRNYEALLLGQILGTIPDPLPFWHSSRKREPGVNLALYENNQVDELLEKARITSDQEEQRNLLEQFQDILVNDLPAIFLYRLDYIHFVSPNIKGYNSERIVSPAKRFATAIDWYVRTKRVWHD